MDPQNILTDITWYLRQTGLSRTFLLSVRVRFWYETGTLTFETIVRILPRLEEINSLWFINIQQMGLSHKIPYIFLSEFRGFRRVECSQNFFMWGLDVSILLSGKNVPSGYCILEDFWGFRKVPSKKPQEVRVKDYNCRDSGLSCHVVIIHMTWTPNLNITYLLNDSNFKTHC